MRLAVAVDEARREAGGRFVSAAQTPLIFNCDLTLFSSFLVEKIMSILNSFGSLENEPRNRGGVYWRRRRTRRG